MMKNLVLKLASLTLKSCIWWTGI